MNDRFFERELKGENALTRATAAKLCKSAVRIGKIAPWCDLNESDLLLVRDDRGQLHAVSVMGSQGEFRAVSVYVGAEGYRFFEQVQSSAEENDMDLFIGRQHAVRVEFDQHAVLEGEDRVLLKEVAPELLIQRRNKVPLFRTVRPGYMEWFITEEEGRLLELALEALLHLLDTDGISRDQGPPYPLVEWVDGILQVGTGRPPQSPPDPLRTSPIDQRRVDDIKVRFPLSKEPIIVDHFYTPTRIGHKFERKMAMRATLAMDGATGVALAPNLADPSARTEELLGQALLDAIWKIKRIPAMVVVRKEEYQGMLQPLADEFGMRIMVIRRIPPLEDFKAMMRVGMK